MKSASLNIGPFKVVANDPGSERGDLLDQLNPSRKLAGYNKLSYARLGQIVASWRSRPSYQTAGSRRRWGPVLGTSQPSLPLLALHGASGLTRRPLRSAIKVTRRLGTTSKSAERSRRPTLDELEADHGPDAQRETQRPSVVPMTRMVAYAIFSTRRQAEITRIRWDDLDEKESRILVRDMKNLGERIGNHGWVDLRHERISRLFGRERRSRGVGLRASLKRCIHIRQRGDRYAGWRGLVLATGTYQSRV